MYRDFQFYDSRIVDYTRIGETLTLFCVYGIHEKWRTCFYRVKDLVGEDFLVGSVISFFGYEHPGSGYTLFFRNSSRTASVVTPEHWRRRVQGDIQRLGVKGAESLVKEQRVDARLMTDQIR